MCVAVARSSRGRMEIGELSFIPHMDRHCGPGRPNRWQRGAWTRGGVPQVKTGPRRARGWIRAGIDPGGVSGARGSDVGGDGQGCLPGRTGTGVLARVDVRRSGDRTTRGADVPMETSAPRKAVRAAPPPGRLYMPAARSWSRSTRDDAGKCCGLFSPSAGRASSWRCFTTVRLATMAARAIKPTPKVRISASRSGESWRAVRSDLHRTSAISVPNDRSFPRRSAGVTLAGP